MQREVFSEEGQSNIPLSPLRLYNFVVIVAVGSFILGSSLVLLLDNLLIHLAKGGSIWHSFGSNIAMACGGCCLILSGAFRINQLIRNIRKVLVSSRPSSG